MEQNEFTAEMARQIMKDGIKDRAEKCYDDIITSIKEEAYYNKNSVSFKISKDIVRIIRDRLENNGFIVTVKDNDVYKKTIVVSWR